MVDLNLRLEQGLAALSLAATPFQRERLLAYLALLSKWNRAYNLTAIRDPQEMVDRHLLDSLSVAPHLERRRKRHGGLRVIDVGTGPGLPGIPLALLHPDSTFFLLDSNGKKTRFLTQVKAELGLGNVTVVHSRVEDYHPEALFDVVIARAFASLADILAGSRHLLAPRGRILAMKGAVHPDELAGLPEGVSTPEVVPLTVPGLEHEARHLISIGVFDAATG